MTSPNAPTKRRSRWLDQALLPFAPVRDGEGMVALLMFVCVFSILCAYYALKTAREGLILSGGMFGLRGDELKTYATGVMAVAFVAIVPAYGALASRVRRIRLINVSYAIVLSCLLGFFALGQAGVPIGLAFYIWLGLVNMLLVAQFWSFATDVYSEEQGKRLFALIAIGGAAGAICGPRIAALAETYTLLVVAAGLFAVSLVLFNSIDRLSVARSAAAAKVAAQPIGGEGGFALVLRDRYLLLLAAMALLANLVNSTGEYVLANLVSERAAELEPALRREYIKLFYADLFFWVNLAGFTIQAFLVSRVIGRIGVRGAVLVLPLIALASYGAMATVGGLALVRVAKIAENATDYSLQNTVRQALFLPTARAVKYKAKTAIDTFFVRFGDALSAILIGLALHQLSLDARSLAAVNFGLVTVWLAVAVAIARRFDVSQPANEALPAGAH
jgi:AAA family ATP:ADP antiporter